LARFAPPGHSAQRRAGRLGLRLAWRGLQPSGDLAVREATRTEEVLEARPTLLGIGVSRYGGQDVSVYVDNAFAVGDWARWTGGGHLQADTTDELHDFARRLGLRREWFQGKPGRPENDHYDLGWSGAGAGAGGNRRGQGRRDQTPSGNQARQTHRERWLADHVKTWQGVSERGRDGRISVVGMVVRTRRRHTGRFVTFCGVASCATEAELSPRRPSPSRRR